MEGLAFFCVHDSFCYPLDHVHGYGVAHHPVARPVGHRLAIVFYLGPVVRESLKTFTFNGSESAGDGWAGYCNVFVKGQWRMDTRRHVAAQCRGLFATDRVLCCVKRYRWRMNSYG